MEIKEVIGIDVSKLKLDCCIHGSQELKTFRNDLEGIKKMIRWSLKKSGADRENLLFVLEHTGLYSDHLVRSLDRDEYYMNIVSGLEIKRSLGITRGKDDRADSKRIALYGYRTREEDPSQQSAQFNFGKVETADVHAQETGRSTGRPYGDSQGAKKGAGRGSAPVLGAGGYHQFVELEDKRS